MMPRVGTIFVVLLLAVGGTSNAATWHVDDSHTNPTDTYDGMGWATCFRHLQEALDASAPLDTIKVAQGTYYPDLGTGHSSDARTETFKPKVRVEVFGGYIGFNDSSPDTRDSALYATILSGDLTQNDTANFGNFGENAYHVLDLSISDDATLVDGFTITHGNADGGGGNPGSSLKFGGGIFNNAGATNGAARVVDCVISANKSEFRGGGVYISSGVSSPGLAIETCTVSGNRSHDGGGVWSNGVLNIITSVLSGNATSGTNSQYFGGAIYASAGPLDIRGGSLITGNSAGKGGGIWCVGSTDLKMRETTISENTATAGVGGGIAYGASSGSGEGLLMVNCDVLENHAIGGSEGGGGVYIGRHDQPAIELVNVRFRGNEALDGARGGGLFAYPQKNFRATNCLFYRNSAEGTEGGAIFARGEGDDPDRILQLYNCTIADNEATGESGLGAGLYHETEAHVTIQNGIFWENIDSSGATSSAQIHAGSTPGTILVSYSDVQGGYSGTGNISANPQFVSPSTERYQLRICSPCCDAGSNPALGSAEDPGDLDGDFILNEATPKDHKIKDRRQFNDFVADTGSGTAPIVDMGVYETPEPGCTLFGDLNEDTEVNGKDIQPFVDCFLETPFECPCADFNLDGIVYLEDVPPFVFTLISKMEVTPDSCEFEDCNENGTWDVIDVFYLDCNSNGVPDDCDVDPEDPDGNEEVSADENENGVPDECEGEQMMMGGGGESMMGSAAGGGGETESGAGGTNPTGEAMQAYVAFCRSGTDCDGNGRNDLCDLRYGPSPIGGMDCNENGTLDECDVSCGSSEDVNGNGFPDECDAAVGLSAEELAAADTAFGALPMHDRLHARAAFYDWMHDQRWGPNAQGVNGQDARTTAEQFGAMVEKMRELGVPVRGR